MVAPRLLVIDDSLTIRRVLELALGGAGWRLEVAATGRAGITLARAAPPALILLDYVLPDLPGAEVCSLLAADPATSTVPVVVMSGKDQEIRQFFRNQRTVVDFVAKPFTPAEIIQVVTRALGGGPGTTSSLGVVAPHATTAVVAARPPTATVTAAPANPSTATIGNGARNGRAEAAARVLYQALKERLARIPEWLGALGDQSPAPFLARRLFTPEVMEQALKAWPADPAAPAPVAPPPAPALAGELGVIDLPRLIRLLGEAGRTGELVVEDADGATSLWFEHGDLMLVVARDPAAWARGATAALAGIETSDPAAWAAACAEHATTGKPLPLALRDRGALALDEPSALCGTVGRAELQGLLARGAGRFAWRACQPVPEFVALCGRRIDPVQIALERLRQVDDWSQIELQVRHLGQVFRRAPGWAALRMRLELDPAEHALLDLIDGRSPLRALVDRAGRTTFEVFHAVFRLQQVGLVVADDAPEIPAGVLLCDGDADGIGRPLGELCAALGERLVTVADHAALVATVRRAPPRLALVAAADSDAVGAIAARLAGEPATAEMALVALLDAGDDDRVAACLAAGCAAALVKPFPRRDLAAVLAAHLRPATPAAVPSPDAARNGRGVRDSALQTVPA